MRLDGTTDSMLLRGDNLLAVTAGGDGDGDSDGDGDGASPASAPPSTAPAPAAPREELVRAVGAEGAAELGALGRLEMMQLMLLHRRAPPAEHELRAAKSALGLRVALGGALGKRTKHQMDATSQLVLTTTLEAHALPRARAPAAEGAADGDGATDAGADDDGGLPPRVDGDGSDVLGTINLSDESEGAAAARLRPTEQLAVLAQCTWLWAARPAHQATLVEMEPYISAAMAAPRCWAAQTQALRLRVRVDGDAPRRRHRALMQLQALFDDLRAAAPAGDTFLGRHLGVTEGDGGEQLAAAGINGDGAGGGAAGAAEAAASAASSSRRAAARRRGLWATALAPRWAVGAELARTLGALSLFTEAVRLFEELELWDEMVSCLIVLQRGWEAEDIVRRRLDDAKTATPAMHCYLGDLQKEESHYAKAWEKSNGSCARAKLSLGAAAMAREAWAEARAHLKDALRVKAHYHQAWYSSALCALKLGDDDGALVDLRKVIAIDPTQLHAWAHLGALFQKKKLKREALYAFREVTRLRGDDWRHWQNRALSAVSLAHFEEALFCARRSMEAGGPADAEVTSLVAQALHKRLPAAHGATGDRLFAKLRAFCVLCCTKEPQLPKHWAVRVYVERECGGGSRRELRDALVGQAAALKEHTAWKTDADTLAALVEATAQLAVEVIDEADVAQARATHKLVRSLLHGAMDSLGATPATEELRMLDAKFTRHLDD